MDDALIGAVVLVDEQWEPPGREVLVVHCEAVVLARDEAAPYISQLICAPREAYPMTFQSFICLLF